MIASLTAEAAFELFFVVVVQCSFTVYMMFATNSVRIVGSVSPAMYL